MYQLRSKGLTTYQELSSMKKLNCHTNELYQAINNDYMSLILQMKNQKKINYNINNIIRKNQRIQNVITKVIDNNILSMGYYRLIKNLNSFLDKEKYDILYKLNYYNQISKIEGNVDFLMNKKLLIEKFNYQHNDLEYPYYMIAIKNSNIPSEYQLIKQSANLYYTSQIGKNYIENKFYFILDSETFEIKKIEIEKFIPTFKKLFTNIRKFKNSIHLYNSIDTIGNLLYPNMKIDSEWNKEKKEFANEIGELTLLWGITDKQRQIAFKQNVYSWKDDNFTSELIGFNGYKKNILDNILKINRCNKNWININQNEHILNIFHSNKTNIYIDFEYTNDYLYLIGVYYKNNYYSFWMNHLDENEEEKNLITFNTFLNKININCNIIYWYAEKNKYINKCNQYNLSYQCNDWIDFCKLLKSGPITIKYAFDFKLKSIINALYHNNKINYKYSDLECQNGLESIELANQFYSTFDFNIKESIEKYNKMDCIAMFDIFRIIKKLL
jgi:hypothetical protein